MNIGHFAAIYIDFENLYYSLKHNTSEEFGVLDALTRLIKNLQLRTQESLSAKPILQSAYADWDNLEQDAARSLMLSGVEPCYALGTAHKNAADMSLCVDVVSTLYNRRDISFFVLAAGDRDYIPVINHLVRAGKTVYVVSFKNALSGDLKRIVGVDSIWFADDLLDPADREQIAGLDRQKLIRQKEELVRKEQERTRQLEAAQAPAMAAVATPQPIDIEFEPAEDYDDAEADDVLNFLVKKFSRYPEIWLHGAYRDLSWELPYLNSEQVRSIVAFLDDVGAIKHFYRPMPDGKQVPVALLNPNHPRVRAFWP